MSFLESYKRLDNLCKDMFRSEKGVTTYIELMEQNRNKGKSIPMWDSEYRKLKHYRYVRNRLVHDNDVYESDMVDETDIQWIDNFRHRMLTLEDSLSVLFAPSRSSHRAPSKQPHREQPSNRQKHRSYRRKKEGCYIATAVYGSYNCPQVWVLRRYRDEILLNSRCGRAFVRFYYFVSPPLVAIFGKSKRFNAIFRRIIDSKVKTLKMNGFSDASYSDES